MLVSLQPDLTGCRESNLLDGSELACGERDEGRFRETEQNKTSCWAEFMNENRKKGLRQIWREKDRKMYEM